MAEKARQTLHPEDEISHYRIVSPLGAGGMGEVYLAEDKTLGRNVALKILPLDLVRNEDRVRRFEFEARSASQLSHPNIVTIYEIGRHPVRSAGAPDSEPLHYIAMEVVSGKTLGSLIHEERADLRTLLGYLAQAAEGLAKAHAAGIVHRDLKPGNLMVSADGFTKVLDFGLAKLTERSGGGADLAGSPTLTAGSEVGSIVGTAGYMSPEQVAGRPVDTRSDIFSFGCVLYEAATRREPFAASTGVETMHKILNEKPVPVEELNDKAPAELRRLIRRCLAKSPDQRVQSIKDLALELREIVEEYDALSASASSASSIAGAPPAVPPRRRIATPAFAAVALLGVAGLAFGLWALFGKRSAPPAAAFATMRMSTQTSRGDVADATLSTDGRYLAYVAGRLGLTGLRVRQVATGSDVEVLPESEAGVEFPAFSPDGNYLYYLSRKPDNRQYRALYSVPSLGGTPREILFDVDSRVTFSPDGKQVAFWRGVPQKQQNLLVVFDLAELARACAGDSRHCESFSGRARLVARRPDAGSGTRTAAPRARGADRPLRGRERGAANVPRAPASSLVQPRLAAGRQRPGRGRSEPQGQSPGAGLPDHLPRRPRAAGDQRLPPLFRSLGRRRPGADRCGPCHRRRAPDPARQHLARRRRERCGRHGPSAHLDLQPGEVADELLGGRSRTGGLRRAERSDPPGLDRERCGRGAAGAHRRIQPLRQRPGRRWRDRLRSSGRVRSARLAHGARRHRLAATHPGERRAAGRPVAGRTPRRLRALGIAAENRAARARDRRDFDDRHRRLRRPRFLTGFEPAPGGPAASGRARPGAYGLAVDADRRRSAHGRVPAAALGLPARCGARTAGV